MTEIVQPGVLKEKPKRKFKVTDGIVFTIVVIVLVLLAVKLISSIRLKSEVSAARTVANQVITDVANQNGAAARNLGDKSFQDKNSTAYLNQVFSFIASNVKGSPSVVSQTVDKFTKPDTVYILYKYSGKTPYYIRVSSQKLDGKWYLTSISGKDNESKLTITK